MPSRGENKASILIVDDTEANVFELVEFFSDEYEVSVATDGATALAAVAESPPDLILLDIMMPGMDGYEVCRRLKAQKAHRHIPVIFLTVLDETASLTQGFAAGAVDYICRPFNLLEVRARVSAHMSLLSARRSLQQRHAILERMVSERSRDLALTQDIAILSLASLAETRDNDTSGHLLRTQRYVRTLAARLASRPRHGASLDGRAVEMLFKSAPLHDIGKVGIPDAILLKPGGLTPEEFAVMQSHCRLGHQALVKAEQLYHLPEKPFFLTQAKEIAYTHHEKWDGSGYPRGLAGDAIPLGGRLMAVADVYDTLVSRRVYKPALPHEQAVEVIAEGRGAQFDPEVVDAFMAVRRQIKRIASLITDDQVKSQSGAQLPGRRSGTGE